MRWGILGTGQIAAVFARTARRSGLADVLAVGSRSQEAGRAFAEERGIVRSVTYAEILSDPEIEAVYVATPNVTHGDLTLRALEAGKHVLCEKPLGEASVVRVLADRAAGVGRLLEEGLMWRHAPFLTALDTMAAKMGGVSCLRATFGFRVGSPTDVRLSPALDGGAAWDLGCYGVSAARRFLGEPTTVRGLAERGTTGVDDVASATLGFASGHVAQVLVSIRMPLPSELLLICPGGWLLVREPWRGRAVSILRNGRRVRRVEKGDVYEIQLERFCQGVRGMRPLHFGVDDAVRQAQAMSALRIAVDSPTCPA